MFLPCLLLPFALLQSAPSSARLLGRDDLGFARKLHEAGFDDLARKICAAVTDAAKAGGGFTPDDVLEATILGFESEASEAETIGDLDARKKRLDDILARAGTFGQTLPDGPKADRLNQALASAQQIYAETLLTMMQGQLANPSSDPKVVAKMRTDADKYFASAEEGLQKRIKLEQDLHSQASDDAALEAIDRKLILDEYSLAGMYYRHSILLVGNDVKRRVVLHSALDALAEFELDWSNELLAYNAYIYEGLCHKELGEDDKAVESFDYAIALRETFGPAGADGVYKIPADAADIVSFAVLQKVLFLNGKKDWAGAVATAQEFEKTIPDALKTQQGLAILSALADAQLGAGDTEGVTATAKQLIQADPQGGWGGRGNQLLAKAAESGGVDPVHPEMQLRLAATYSDNKDYKRSHAACRQARVLAEGTPAEADVGADSFLTDGIAYLRDNRQAEACIAFDSAASLYPKGAKAPDALWRSINVYLDLYEKERRGFYKKLTDDRMAQFVKDYPTNPNAVLVSLIAGKQREAEGDYDAASKVYQSVAPTSPAYGEAQYHAGVCLVKQAGALQDQNKLADAEAARKKAQPILETARAALEKQLANTIEPEQHQHLASVAFATRATLAQLLLRNPADADKVLALLKDVETTFAGDQEKIGTAWTLRISALEAEGKLQEAVDMLDNLVQKSPDVTAVGNAAGSLARALDRSAKELVDKDPKATRKAEEALHNAARLYALSVKGQVTGKEAAAPTVLDPVGKRLFALALDFEQAPAGVDNFLDWTPPQGLTQPQLWDQVAAIFEAILNVGPNASAELFLGRVRGLQGQWKEAATAYSKLFELQPIVVTGNPRFDVGRLQSMPELRSAYVEWGMAETMAGKESGDKERLARAANIYEKALGGNNLEAGSQLWWRAKCLQVETMVARGQYDVADITLRDIERTTQDYDQNKYGAKTRLLALKAEVAKHK